MPELFGETLHIRSRVFAATIDFDIEGQAVILCDLTNARAFECGDVHKHVFATIVTLDETESLHVVEEFDGAIGALASRFAHRPALETAFAIAAATVEATTVTTAIAIKAATFRARRAFGNGKRLTIDDKIGGRHLAATINKREFERLPFGQTGQARLFHGADMDEDIIGTIIDLNEAEALLIIEEFDNALAFANHLGRHCRTTRGTATRAAETAPAAKAATAAARATKAAAGALSTSQFAGERRGVKTEIVVTETIALVTAAATTLVIETHVRTSTFSSPANSDPCRTGRLPCISRDMPPAPQGQAIP